MCTSRGSGAKYFAAMPSDPGEELLKAWSQYDLCGSIKIHYLPQLQSSSFRRITFYVRTAISVLRIAALIKPESFWCGSYLTQELLLHEISATLVRSLFMRTLCVR